MQQEILIWNNFYNYWQERATETPTHFLSYEQLLSDPKAALTDLMKFLLEKEDLEGLHIEQLIEEATASDKEKPQVYKPRSGKINSN